MREQQTNTGLLDDAQEGEVEVEVEDEQVDAQQGIENHNDEEQESMVRRSQRIKKLPTVVQHEQEVEDKQVDAQQGVDNQNDEEEDELRRSKRIKRLAAVVQTPYTIPRSVKELVYVRKNSRAR